MSNRFNYSIDFSSALKKLEQLPRQIQGKAIVHTINTVASRAKAEMARNIYAEFNLKKSDINAQLSISKANRNQYLVQAKLSAVNKERGHPGRNVMIFGAQEVKGKGKKKQVRVQFKDGSWRTLMVREGGGVSVKIKRTGGRKLIPHAFIANKGRTVFIRKEDGSLKSIRTIDVPNMFNTRRIYEKVVEKIRLDLITQAERDVKFYGGQAMPGRSGA